MECPPCHSELSSICRCMGLVCLGLSCRITAQSEMARSPQSWPCVWTAPFWCRWWCYLLIDQYIKQPLQQCCIGTYGGMGQCAGPLLILQLKSKMYAVCTAFLCLIILKIGDLWKNVFDTKCVLCSSLKLLFLDTFCDIILIIKPTRCTDFSNSFLEWNCTCFRQFLCPLSGVFHCTHSNGICHTVLQTACEQVQAELARKPSAIHTGTQGV
jgi:hypothetical protein